MNLASWVLVGGVAGILIGITFGESCAILSPIGFVYVGLLQAAVYPYLICSLLHGLASLDPSKAWRLFKSGWLFYVAAWVVTFACLAALAQAIAPVQPAVIGDTPAQQQRISKLLGLLIPTDLFTALSQNYVPAVVIFCIFYGVALQSLKDKAPLLSILETIRLASLKFWNWIVRLAPFGVFALFAVTAGTTAFSDLVNMSVYLILFLLGTCVLAFWVLPALVSALAPVGHREVVVELRSALADRAAPRLTLPSLLSLPSPGRQGNRMWNFPIPFFLAGRQMDSKVALESPARFQNCVWRQKIGHMRLPCPGRGGSQAVERHQRVSTRCGASGVG
jgi:proton glutamate symport protein